MNSPRFSTLQAWLDWQLSLHVSAIDLELGRVQVVAERMKLLKPAFPLATIAGTNGKGSTAALLTSILQSQGTKVGTFTSPHFLRYNERIAINRQSVSDTLICEAFAAIDTARGDISLTYFEFGALAAMWVFMHEGVDVAVLEVGLGGRLDAVNIWDADVAIITSIGIDHVEWLGDDRELIGREKAGIMRAAQLAICGDPEPPASIAQVAAETSAVLMQNGRDFTVTPHLKTQFNLHFHDPEQPDAKSWMRLARPKALPGEVQMQNAACAFLAYSHLAKQALVPELRDMKALDKAMRTTGLTGRLQRLQTKPDVYADVAHNPHAALNLSHWLKKMPVKGKNVAIFSILADKDVTGVLKALETQFTEWHFVPLPGERGLSLEALRAAAETAGVQGKCCYHDDIERLWAAVIPSVKADDRVVAFGSFLLVSQLLDRCDPSK